MSIYRDTTEADIGHELHPDGSDAALDRTLAALRRGPVPWASLPRGLPELLLDSGEAEQDGVLYLREPAVFAELRRLGEEERAEPISAADLEMLERVKAAVVGPATHHKEKRP